MHRNIFRAMPATGIYKLSPGQRRSTALSNKIRGYINHLIRPDIHRD